MRQCPGKTTASALKLAAGAGLLLLLQACGTPQPVRETAPVKPAASAPAARPTLAGRMTVDAQEYPWSALGRVNLAGQGFCTGIVIGPALVLTQARCLYAGREGRWFRPQELHFIAAYQRDSYLADSGIADFTVAPGFNPAAGTSLDNITNNWALLRLQQPIGEKTGWLSINWDDTNLGPDSVFLRAGFRRDRPHAVNLHFGCAARSGALDVCAATPAEQSLPAFVLVEGELRIVGEYYTRWASRSPLLLEAAQRQGGAPLPAARPPSDDGRIDRQPTATVSQLLAALGYPVVGGDVAAAAGAFRRDQGLPAGSSADIALMTALLSAAQRQAP